MALWGKLDEAAVTGTSVAVAVGSPTLVGIGTSFLTQLSIGDTVTLGVNKYVIASVISNTSATITPVGIANVTDTTPQVTKSPKYLTPDQSRTEVSLVTTAEAGEAPNRVNGVKTPGWTLYTEYGNGRNRVETLVAMKT